MGRRPLAGSARPSIGALLLLTSVFVVATTAAGVLVLYDDPAGHLGVGAVDGEEFSYVDPPGEAYSKAYEFSMSGGRRLLSSAHYANGTSVVVERTIEGSEETTSETPLERVSYGRGGVRYERRVFEDGYRPEFLEPHVYFEEETNSVYERNEVERSDDEGSRYELRQAFTRYRYVENGSQRWRGDQYIRYEVLDPRGVVERLTDAREVRGYLLVDEDDRVRYGEFGYEEGLVYRTYGEPREPVPIWSSWIGSKFESGSPVANLSAYHLGSSLMLVSPSQWTPEDNATVALAYEYGGEEPKTDVLPAGEPVFRRQAEEVYVAYLSIDGEEIELSRTRPQAGSGGDRHVTTPVHWKLLFDRRGLNVVETPVEPRSNLGEVYSVTPAHLKPENGGGRVLRFDDLELGERFTGDDTVTLTVENSTDSRSVTRRAGDVSSDRFYLIRTSDDLEIENSGGIATHVKPTSSFAERSFVADATLRITARGAPIYRVSLPERVTQDSEKPRDQILTGVGVQLYDTPPDSSMLGQGGVIRSMDWQDHVLLKVHSWDYDLIRVTGGEAIGVFQPVLKEDETGYYRMKRGERYSVETEDGDVLVEGRAKGSRLVSS